MKTVYALVVGGVALVGAGADVLGPAGGCPACCRPGRRAAPVAADAPVVAFIPVHDEEDDGR